MKRGPTGVELSSAYDKRSNPQVKDEMGQAVARLARHCPHGLLLFFPSYTGMQDALEAWKVPAHKGRPSVLASIEHCKTVVYEPRGKTDLSSEMAKYYRLLDDKNGAAFFAVCRGKVSEGLDFADKKGRAVIIAGLPFPPLKDPKVVLKREYLNSIRSPDSLRGDEWYQQQATRAVNQAVGRVIRHRHDFGAIILADSRFADNRISGQLSKWIRPRMVVHTSFSECETLVYEFFQRWKPGLPSVGAGEIRADDPLPAEHVRKEAELQRIDFGDGKPGDQSAITAALQALTTKPAAAAARPPPNSAAYLQSIKARLSKEGRSVFKQLLNKYKAKDVDIGGVLAELHSMFKRENCTDLLYRFGQFVPARHQAAFRQLLSSIPPAPRPQHRPPRPQPQPPTCAWCAGQSPARPSSRPAATALASRAGRAICASTTTALPAASSSD